MNKPKINIQLPLAATTAGLILAICTACTSKLDAVGRSRTPTSPIGNFTARIPPPGTRDTHDASQDIEIQGDAQLKAGDWMGAIGTYEKAQIVAMDHPRAWKIGRVYEEHGQVEKALDYYRDTMLDQPNGYIEGDQIETWAYVIELAKKDSRPEMQELIDAGYRGIFEDMKIYKNEGVMVAPEIATGENANQHTGILALAMHRTILENDNALETINEARKLWPESEVAKYYEIWARYTEETKKKDWQARENVVKEWRKLYHSTKNSNVREAARRQVSASGMDPEG